MQGIYNLFLVCIWIFQDLSGLQLDVYKPISLSWTVLDLVSSCEVSVWITVSRSRLRGHFSFCHRGQYHRDCLKVSGRAVTRVVRGSRYQALTRGIRVYQ